MKFKPSTLVFVVFGFAETATAQQDKFNYRSTSGRDYGPKDWDEVSCSTLGTCPGWPDKLEGSIGWKLQRNQCRSCPIEGNSCGQHRQSPIDLFRDRAIPGNPNEKECPDWHWIQFKDGTCSWEDVQDQFKISRHALQLFTPLKSNGDVDCVNEKNERKFPKLDYSKGFPDWWYLSRTDISVPSEHVQHGQRYAAEVVLSHFYEIDHYKNKLGKVSIFMQDFEGEPAWNYLDKLICQWRQVEEKKRSACNLDPAPVYKMCELYRGQVRTEADLYDSTGTTQEQYPTRAPLIAPKSIPITNFGGDPEEFRLPLQLCQGDCDFSTDCASGLICHRRDAFGEIPGCIGGGSDRTNTDYCVFDPYGDGYHVPTPTPTTAPTVTARPSLSPLDPIPLIDYGSTPPADRFPLQLCEGDCDNDDHCATGLLCFQRHANEIVPGCIGGETDIKNSDYCILDRYGSGYTLPPVDPATGAPTVSAPKDPTNSPTASPTSAPTDPLTKEPTKSPTDGPTMAPVPTAMPTYYPRPTGPPKNITNIGWEPETPLQECDGDCDEDSDCGEGLYCFQRYALRTPVPGCLGGENDDTLTDYCVYREIPTGTPSAAPSGDGTPPPQTKPPTSNPTVSFEPTSNPTNGPTSKPVDPTQNPTKSPVDESLVSKSVINKGWSPNEELGECEGDCDTNDSCALGLKCYQRNNANTPVPGCADGELDDTLTDYCVKDPAFNPDASEAPGATGPPISSSTPGPSMSQTSFPTSIPTESPSEKPVASVVVDPIPLINRGWSPPSEHLPLGNCEGDCDTDTDCMPGLKCFQRYLPSALVPGCLGGELDETLVDYCAVDGAAIPPPPKDGTSTRATSSPTSDPTPAPTPDPTPGPVGDTIPNTIECDAFNVNYQRMCKEDSCCQDPRSSSPFCHETYLKLGDSVDSACHHCCKEEIDLARTVGSATPQHATIEQSVSCDKLENPQRMCKPDSCCEEDGFDSDWCKEQLGLWPDALESICWYCCFPAKEVTFDYRRKLQENEKTEDREIGENDRVTHDVDGRQVIVRKENFEAKGMDDEQAYFDEIHGRHLREMQTVSAQENYDDVLWWPYEWLLKVGTEYYFRYEGTQTVPPCYDTAHWRVMKDPIRVAPHQMRELERLVAWRIGDTNCRVDTAGTPREGNPDAVDVNRPLQSYHKLHRKVFCECKDWPSKFPQDRAWCRNHNSRPPEQRLIDSPYNWPSEGFNLQ